MCRRAGKLMSTDRQVAAAFCRPRPFLGHFWAPPKVPDCFGRPPAATFRRLDAFLADVQRVGFFDESLAPLDPASKLLVIRELQRFCAQSLVLLIYHADEADADASGPPYIRYYHRRDLENTFIQTDFHKICSNFSAIFSHFSGI